MKQYKQLEVSEIMENVFVGEMKINGRKSFNMDLLDDLTEFFMFVYQEPNIDGKNRFFVFTGEQDSGCFNLGGDLALFLNLVENKDILTLQKYGRKCIDLIHKSIAAKNDNMTSVALVNGNAMGGGFESSLSCDIIIAEKGYTVQLPEIKLGFFPGMGAFELLNKRIGSKLTKDFILKGEVHSTEELYELGVFDYLVEKGESLEKLKEVVKKERASQRNYNSIRKIYDRMNPVSYSELIESVDYWVDTVLDISKKDKRFIQSVIKKQG
jgi:DSF synthase